MNLIFSGLLIFIICIVYTVQGQTDTNISCVPFSSSPGASLRCGGVIEEVNGTIFYKPYERVEANERCVWSLFPPKIGSSRETDYKIHVLYLGFPSNADLSGPRLIFTGIGINDTILENQIILNGTGIFELPLLTRSAMITFTSGDFDAALLDYNGFILQFSSVNDLGVINYADHTIGLPPVKFNYKKAVSVGMVASFIIPPPNNFYDGKEGYPLIYLENEIIESSPLATLHVYHFDISSLEQPWKIVDEVGQGNDTKILQGHTDIQLIVHRASTPANFALFHMRCNE